MDRKTKIIFFSMFGFAALLLVVSGAVWLARRPPTSAPISRTHDDSDDGPTARGSTPHEDATAPPLDPAVRILLAKTAPEAVAIAKFGDSVNTTDPGAALFAAWATDRLDWSDIGGEATTTAKKILKDPDAERGKRVCWSGTIIEIHTIKTAVGKLFDGGLLTPNEQVIRFAAVRDTGEIVQGSSARICGLVVGLADYSNSRGGTTHGIQVVGMFDLPPNHEPPPRKMPGAK